MAAFNPKDLFAAFNKENLVRLAEFYPDDFDLDKLDGQPAKLFLLGTCLTPSCNVSSGE
jgi:hypothetical protein